MKLNGKVAVITGITKGLGAKVAQRFVEEGADVIGFARNQQECRDMEDLLRTIKPLENQMIICRDVDISKPEQVVSFFRMVNSYACNGIDILVNNAGINGEICRFEDSNDEEWIEAINVNLLGSVRTTREALKIMNRPGKIIQLSGGGATSPRQNMTSYGSSKAAIVRFMETLAWELRTQRIDVNCVSPGIMPTRLVDEVINSKHTYCIERRSLQEDSISHDFFMAVELITFLASKKSNGITGKLIAAKWDRWDLFSEHKDEVMNNSNEPYTLRRKTGYDAKFKWDDIT